MTRAARAWFDCGGSAERASQAVSCQPNTLRYRLRRLRESHRRSLAQRWTIAELMVAQAVALRGRGQTLRI